MTPIEILLGQPSDEVRATMTEERCMNCYGCPDATIFAAKITALADVSLNSAAHGVDHDPLYSELAREVDISRQNLHELTDVCSGYRPGLHDPVKSTRTCNSKNTPAISRYVGKVLRLFGH